MLFTIITRLIVSFQERRITIGDRLQFISKEEKETNTSLTALNAIYTPIKLFTHSTIRDATSCNMASERVYRRQFSATSTRGISIQFNREYIPCASRKEQPPFGIHFSRLYAFLESFFRRESFAFDRVWSRSRDQLQSRKVSEHNRKRSSSVAEHDRNHYFDRPFRLTTLFSPHDFICAQTCSDA